MAQLDQLPGIGEVVADKYRIERLLGQGGMGAVFLAQHLVTDKRVALKWMLTREDATADDIERFIREAKAAARIEHPNIVDIYDVGEHAGSFFLVMEYLAGRSFADAVKAAPLPAAATLRSLLPAMRGVHAAHKRGVVHRDLKPDNIFLCFDEDGEPITSKVLDFGISKLREHKNTTAPSLTHTGMVMGTPHYIAPEQAEDAKSVDARADVYAMGVILYQALGGNVPFEAESLTALLLKITRGSPRPLQELQPELPEGLCDAVMKAMSLRPDDRFADMAELIAALAPYVGSTSLPVHTLPPGGDEVSATPFAAPSQLARAEQGNSRTRPLFYVAGAVVLLLAVLWLVLAPQAEPPVAEQPLAPEVPVPAAAANVEEPAAAPAPIVVQPEPTVDEGEGSLADGEDGLAETEADEAAAVEPEPERQTRTKARKKRLRRKERTQAAPPQPPDPSTAVAQPATRPRAKPSEAPPPASTATPTSTKSGKGRLGIEMRPDQF